MLRHSGTPWSGVLCGTGIPSGSVDACTGSSRGVALDSVGTGSVDTESSTSVLPQVKMPAVERSEAMNCPKVHHVVLGGHCRCTAIWVAHAGIVWVCPEELLLVNKGLHLAGTDMTLEEHWSVISQPSRDRASRCGSSGETEEALVRCLIGSSDRME